jgi:hypothetical protein
MFLSRLCKIVWSRAFHYFSTEQLSYEYAKIYSSKEILRNIIRLSERFQLTPRHFEVINTPSSSACSSTIWPSTPSRSCRRSIGTSTTPSARLITLTSPKTTMSSTQQFPLSFERAESTTTSSCASSTRSSRRSSSGSEINPSTKSSRRRWSDCSNPFSIRIG